MPNHRTDADIKKDIVNELKWNPEVKETDIGVIVKDGSVTLTGFVPNYMSKLAAHNVTKRIAGVRAIVDEVEVKLPFQIGTTDEDIALRISHIFDWNIQIPSDDIKAEVHKGIVTLSGEVNWQFERNYAQKQIEGVEGVKGVVNDIKLRKAASVTDVKTEIEQALRRYANLEASKVKVAVSGGIVTLDGDVNSYTEMDLVEDAAWSAAGVTKVVDNLRVA